MKWIRIILSVLLVALIAIQFVPPGRKHTNPPLTGEPAWDAPRTRELFFRSCGDCHSNRTVWPWYSHVAPASWLVQRDVAEARRRFNVSEWGRPGRNEGDEAAKEVREGAMPLAPYRALHPGARLSAAEREELIAGLTRTFGPEREDR